MPIVLDESYQTCIMVILNQRTKGKKMSKKYNVELTEDQINMLLSALADYQDYIDPDDENCPVDPDQYADLVLYLNSVN